MALPLLLVVLVVLLVLLVGVTAGFLGSSVVLVVLHMCFFKRIGKVKCNMRQVTTTH